MVSQMELPLFPLKTVLFPRSQLPLNIFEERYKLMIGGCLESKGEFGVALIRSGKEAGGPAEPFKIGTTARIIRSKTTKDGRLNIVCVGQRRFRIVSLHHDRPYLIGKVDPLDSDREDETALSQLTKIAAALFGQYFQLCLSLSNQWTRSIDLPSDADALADVIAPKLPVSTAKKQRLLETLSVGRRLDTEIKLLKKGTFQMRQRVAVARALKYNSLAALS